jgi:hypothetical protein
MLNSTLLRALHNYPLLVLPVAVLACRSRYISFAYCMVCMMLSVGWSARTTRALSGVCGKSWSGGRLTDLEFDRALGGRRTSLAQQYYRRQTNPHPLQTTSILHRKHGRLLLSPRHRQGRLSLRTSSSRTTDPFGAIMRRIRDGRTARHISRRGKNGRQMELSTTADMSRTTACDRCPQHHVRRCIPPFRRQLQGCPAVSSHQGLQQGRGGLHPVRSEYHTRHFPSNAHVER